MRPSQNNYHDLETTVVPLLSQPVHPGATSPRLHVELVGLFLQLDGLVVAMVPHLVEGWAPPRAQQLREGEVKLLGCRTVTLVAGYSCFDMGVAASSMWAFPPSLSVAVIGYSSGR